MKNNFTRDEMIDAFNLAIGYLDSEECSYDDEGNYKNARRWLSGVIEKLLYKTLKKYDAGKE